MQIHQLKPSFHLKDKKRIGRGGKKGTYSGRGSKGQKARGGRKLVPIIRELIKHYPKLKGYRQKQKFFEIVEVNFKQIEKNFAPQAVISPKSLWEKRIIKKKSGKIPTVKILAVGKLIHPFIFRQCLFSKKAKLEIEKKGGTILNNSLQK